MTSRRWVALAIVGVAVGSMLYVRTAGEPELPIGLANGSYENPNLGSLVVENGRMTLNNQYVSYIIERDKIGPYLLPKFYVGVSDHSFVVRRGGNPLKLRLDRDAHPDNLILFDDIAGNSLAFARMKAVDHQRAAAKIGPASPAR